MIKVMTERHCKPGKEAELEKLLVELRVKAMQQPGFYAEELLRLMDDPSVLVVIISWYASAQREAWEKNPQRQNIIRRIEPLLLEPAKVRVFQ